MRKALQTSVQHSLYFRAMFTGRMSLTVAQHSLFFRAMFKGRIRESQQKKEVTIGAEISAEAFELNRECDALFR